MGRKGNCYDKAPMESFWGVLKNEQIHHCRYATRQEAIQDITGYLEISYNRQGRQARLGFLSLPLLNDGSMKNDWQHEIFGVHY